MLRMTWNVQACPKRMHGPGINGEGELRGQPANPGSPGKMAVKTECVCVCVVHWVGQAHVSSKYCFAAVVCLAEVSIFAITLPFSQFMLILITLKLNTKYSLQRTSVTLKSIHQLISLYWYTQLISTFKTLTV